jgi:hypothetical protein
VARVRRHLRPRGLGKPTGKHWRRKCPHLEEAIAQIKKNKAEKEKKEKEPEPVNHSAKMGRGAPPAAAGEWGDSCHESTDGDDDEAADLAFAPGTSTTLRFDSIDDATNPFSLSSTPAPSPLPPTSPSPTRL